MPTARTDAFPLGARVTLAQLERDPHPVLARLREREPVSWVPTLGGWLVTRRDLAMEVMRDAQRFTVDDPRFSTARVVGASMLSLDGAGHKRHRDPFARPFRLEAVRARFSGAVARETDRLLDGIAPAGAAELRRSLAGPLAAVTMTVALGLETPGVRAVLRWYDAIVGSVTEITSGGRPTAAGAEAAAALREAIEPALRADPEDSLLAAAAAGLDDDGVAANAAVLLFGGIETTEGMIANAVAHLLADADALAAVRADPALIPGAIEESLRLEPAAAVVDRYATRATRLGGAEIAERELVVVSIAGANRDPAVFPAPDRFDIRRANARLHLAFAHGPHVCLGMHLARLEAHTAVARVLARLPGLRLDPAADAAPHGLVFRKPAALRVRWDAH
jgi:cytochrome P450